MPAKAMIVSCPWPLLWLVLVLPTLQKMTKASAAVARIQCGVEATQPPKRRDADCPDCCALRLYHVQRSTSAAAFGVVLKRWTAAALEPPHAGWRQPLM